MRVSFLLSVYLFIFSSCEEKNVLTMADLKFPRVIEDGLAKKPH
jgi:hypothetical protein